MHYNKIRNWITITKKIIKKYKNNNINIILMLETILKILKLPPKEII